MKEGKEPMRSFSDLIQFMQPKRTEPLPNASTPPESAKPNVGKPISSAITNDEPDTSSIDNSLESVVHSQFDSESVQTPAKHVLESNSEDAKIASESVE